MPRKLSLVLRLLCKLVGKRPVRKRACQQLRASEYMTQFSLDFLLIALLTHAQF
jgi:hypothetical protein